MFVDNSDFNNKPEYHQEIQYTQHSVGYNSVDVLENFYTVPYGDGFISYSLSENEDGPYAHNMLLPSAMAAEVFADLYDDESTDVDLIAEEMIKFLSLFSEETQAKWVHSNHEDDTVRQAALNVFRQINDIISTKKNNSQYLQQIKAVLQGLAKTYRDNLFFIECHSFEYFSSLIEQIDSQALPDILEKLQAFGNLNSSIVSLKIHFEEILNYLENVRQTGGANNNREVVENIEPLVTIVQKFLRKIETKRQRNAKAFFSEFKEKSLAQEALQTLNSLYIHELNKLAHSLNLLHESFQSLEGKNSSNKDDTVLVELKDNQQMLLPNLKNKKFVIFTCSYGTGHKVTASAIQQTLKYAHAESVIYDLSTGALLGKDRWRQLFKTLGINYNDHPMTAVDVFNEILRNQWYFIVNTKDAIDLFIRNILDISGKDGVTPAIGVEKNSWERTQLRELLMLEKPDQIITTYHMDLNPIYEAAIELGIPILHVPTDYNMKFWEVFDKTRPAYSHFKTAVPNYEIEQTLNTKTPVAEDQLVEQIGIPLRSEFYSFLNEAEKLQFRHSRGINNDEKILFLSAGGNGQSLPHPQQLAHSTTWNIPTRILVIAGKNRDFVTHLQKNLTAQDGNPLLLKGKNAHVTIEIVANPDPSKVGTEAEFFIQADLLSKLLDISDASIAKAGGLSVAELLFKGVPILFDHRVNPFSWELFNIEVIVNQLMGISNFNLNELERDLQLVFQVPKEKNKHFYFEYSREFLCYALVDQMRAAEVDAAMAKRKQHFLVDYTGAPINTVPLVHPSESDSHPQADASDPLSQRHPSDSSGVSAPTASDLPPFPVGNVAGVGSKKDKKKTVFSFPPSSISSVAQQDLSQLSEHELDTDWNLGSYFGEIKVITGNPGSDRFKRCRQELAGVGLSEEDYTVFPGVNGSTLPPSIWQRADNWDNNDTDKQKQGRMGCFMAHYNAIKDSADRLKMARERLETLSSLPYANPELIQQAQADVVKYSSVLIIEDNNGFGRVTGDHEATLEGVGKKMRNTLKELPDNWDMFYFMTMADDWTPSFQVSPNLLRLNYGVLTKCYAVNAKMYPVILEHFEQLLQSNEKIHPVDHILAKLHHNYRCYAPKNEALTYRFGSASEVQNIGQTVEIKNWQPSVNRIIAIPFDIPPFWNFAIPGWLYDWFR